MQKQSQALGKFLQSEGRKSQLKPRIVQNPVNTKRPAMTLAADVGKIIAVLNIINYRQHTPAEQ